jgi:NAD(P)-dependent dehydrogenase (short-subunit alcohol dehydrogenase family)
MNLFNIEKKVIVITGGCGILGSCIASYLAGEGANIVILDRDKAKGMDLAASIKAKGGECIFLESDVLNKEILERNREEIVSKYGAIDVLINAAGGNMPGATITPEQTIFDLKMDDFQKVVDLNLHGTVLPTLVFTKAMTGKGEGNIINFASEAAIRPMTRVAGYAAAKAAVANFTKYMATELALKFGSGFRVNALVPGFFITEQNRALLTNPDGSYTSRGESVIAHTPFRRFGEPEDLLGAVHYLMSDASRFVTGTTLVVDGGFDAFAI